MEAYEAWETLKVISALFVLVSFVLYVVRFCATGHIMSLNEYEAYVKGLFLYFIK